VIWIFWCVLAALLVAMLALDLGVFHRRAHAQTTAEALVWSLIWIATALSFNGFIYFIYEHHWMGLHLAPQEGFGGHEAAIEFLTAYLVEKSLSLDNIFVIALIFTYFQVPLENQHRVLFWGVVGALVMRAFFIISGLALVERFAWTTYLLGAVLVATAVKMLVDRHDALRPEKNALICIIERRFAVTSDFHGPAFFARHNGHRVATPLFLALVVVEVSDLLFAVDSIPAVIAVTSQPFIAFSSNAFAILGLRSLYFVIAPLIRRFQLLKLCLVFILAFIGVKMLLVHHYPIPTGISLAVVLGILALGVGASIIGAKRGPTHGVSPVEVELNRLVRIGVRGATRIAIAVIGSTALLLGIAILLLPSREWLSVPVGLTLLALECGWAWRWIAQRRAAALDGIPRETLARPPSTGPQAHAPISERHRPEASRSE
jgi:tellurite resistance protein TerC